MASRFMSLFFDTEKLAEVNRKYREQKEKNEAHNAEVKFQIEMAKAKNKRDFLAALDTNNAKRDKKLAEISSRKD